MKDNLDNYILAYEGHLYDFDNILQLNWYPQRIISRCGKDKSLLELGLGHGITTEIFSEYFDSHTVLEASPGMIEKFKTKHSKCPVKIIQTYFEDFQTSEKFDVIVMGFVLEHVDDPIKVLKHYKQFLAPKGHLFITVPNACVLNRRIGHQAGMLPDLFVLSDHDRLLGHKRYYTLELIQEDIREAGYSILCNEGIYLKPFSTEQIKSLRLPQNIIDAMCYAGIEYPELCCSVLIEATL